MKITNHIPKCSWRSTASKFTLGHCSFTGPRPCTARSSVIFLIIFASFVISFLLVSCSVTLLYSSIPRGSAVAPSTIPIPQSRKSSLARGRLFVPTSLKFHRVGTWWITTLPSITFDCIQRSFPDKCLICPTPCLEISCLAAELSVNWWCSTSPDTRNCKQLRMKIPSQQPPTILCNSLSAYESEITFCERLEPKQKHPFRKWIEQLVLLLCALFELQSASVYVSRSQNTSVPCLNFPTPCSGNGSLTPMSPVCLMNPISFLSNGTGHRDGEDIADASSLTTNMMSARSRDRYKSNPITLLYFFASAAESFCALSSCCRA